MPFRNGTPLEMNPWVLLYLLFCIFLGLFNLWASFRNGGKGASRGGGQTPYAGHHYERRQAKGIFKRK